MLQSFPWRYSSLKSILSCRVFQLLQITMFVHAAAPAVFASLKTATHVFVREDSTTSPLRLLYRGLYLVL